MAYLILVNIILLLCYLLYIVFLKELTFFQWNRLYLVGVVMLALLVPIGVFIDLPTSSLVEKNIPKVDLVPLLTDSVIPQTADVKTSLYLGDALETIYWAGASLMLVWLVTRLLYIMIMVRKGKFAFSYAFFHRVVIGKDALGREAIVKHENVHAKQGHTYDVLFVELVKAFNWFNPVLYLYLKELKFQHECIADEATATDKVAYAQLLVAQAMQVDTHSFLQGFSNQSLLKKRIVMLFKNKSKNSSKYAYAGAAPLLLLAVISTLVFNSSRAKTMVLDMETTISNAALPSASSPISSPKLLAVESGHQLHSTAVAAHKLQGAQGPEPTIGRVKFMEQFAQEYISPRALSALDKDPFMAVKFDVSSSGQLGDFRLAEGELGSSFFDEAVRLIKKSSWKAAIDSNGNPAAGVGLVMFKLDESGKVRRNYTRIDVSPEPKGGIGKWRQYIGDHYLFPKEMVEKRQKGKFTLGFVLDKTGAIEKLSLIEETIPGTAQPAEVLVNKFGAWAPGIFEGEKVPYQVQFSMYVDATSGYGVIRVDDVNIERIKD